MNTSIFRRLELLDTKARRLRLKNQGDSGINAHINITPLVDVVLVLLIIFMVITPMINEGITLPFAQAPNRVSAQTDDLKIILDPANKIKIGDQVIDHADLKKSLSQELAQNPLRKVYLSADQSVQFVQIKKILQALRDAGAKEVGFLSALSPKEHEHGSSSQIF